MGLTWRKDERVYLETETPFNLINCEKPLKFKFTKDLSNCFPRKDDATPDLTFADFGVFNMINSVGQFANIFQTEELSMTFDNVDFNWFANPQSPMVSLSCL